ncbi:MAG: energy-coupling factor transporter transmembrane protein EcfT [Chloroflexi bacterium]|nr:energy-coupling factor transporter transmembrane protein EcfT [Chloroflexota bacterium]
MSARYDLYQPGSSWLHRLDPRCKLLMALCGSLWVLVWGAWWMVLAVLALAHAALLSAGIARGRLLSVWKVMLPTVALVALLWLVLYPGEPPLILSFWIVRVSWGSLARACTIALRLIALALALFVWLFTTDQTALVRGLAALGLPYPASLTLAMALRYLPTMASALHTISDAQQARALDLHPRNPFVRARRYVPIIVAMLISAVRTAENLARALESRAYGSASRRTALRTLAYRPADWAWTAALLLVTAAALAARWLR